MANTQAKSDKQYLIPIIATPELIRDFQIHKKNIKKWKIGNRVYKTILVPGSEELYYEYVRPLWREAKRRERDKKRQVSFDAFPDFDWHRDTDEWAQDLNPEIIIEKKAFIEALRKLIAAMDAVNQTILWMFADGCSEAAIGKAVGLSQKGVNKRKHKLFAQLKAALKDFI